MLDFLFSVGQTVSVLVMIYGGVLVSSQWLPAKPLRRGPEDRLILRKAY